MRSVQPGAVDISVRLLAINSTTGAPSTGIAYNTAGIDLWYQRDLSAVVPITEVTLATLTTGHTDGGVLHINNGYFRVDVPDAAFLSGAATVMIGGSATGIDIVAAEIQLQDTAPSIRSGTATGGAASTITLDASASAGDNFYTGNVVHLISGTGIGQARMITSYVGATKVATVDRAWGTNPASGTGFRVLPTGVAGMTSTEVAAAVWNAVSASYVVVGSTGKKLSDSGAASVPPTAQQNADALLATTLATGVTCSDGWRGMMAVLFGKTNSTGTTRNFRNIEDTKNAVSATVDVSNQRTAVTRNLTQ